MSRELLTAGFYIVAILTTCSYAQDAMESGRRGASKSKVVTRTEKQVGDLSARIDALTTRVQRLEERTTSQKTHESNSGDSRVGVRRIGYQLGSVRERPTDWKIQIFSVVNADASSMVRILSKLLPEVEAKEVRIVVDKRTNSVLAYGNAQDLGIIEALLLRLDEAVETNDRD